MKKIFILPTALVICSLFLNSCVKLTETPPAQLAPSNFYKTVEDFNAATIGAYQPLFQGYAAFDFNSPFILCYGAEDCTTRPQATDSKLFDELKPSPASGSITSCWSMFYNSINNADAVLLHLPEAKTVPDTRKSEFSGQ